MLLFREIHILNHHNIIVHSTQKDTKQITVRYSVDSCCFYHHARNMSVLLWADGECGSHAGIALSLRIGYVQFARGVDEVVFPRQRRYASMAGFFVGTLVVDSFQVVAELLVSDQVLTIFALLVVRMSALS